MDKSMKKYKEQRFSRQPINEDTILSDGYIIFGDKELWPEMEWKYPLNLSPGKMLSFFCLGLPLSLMFIVMPGANGIYYGIWGTLAFLVIWYLVAKWLSRLDWAVMLTSGKWEDHVKDVNKVLNSDFIINYSTGRVYNRLEEPFVLEYRKSHPGWWRRAGSFIAIKDGEYSSRYLVKRDMLPGPIGFWMTKDEWEMLQKRIMELITKDSRFWDTEEGKRLRTQCHIYGKPSISRRDYDRIAMMEFYCNHKDEIEDEKNI